MAVQLPSSFRDPSGFVFRREGVLYRQISTCYAGQYQRLSASKFLDALTEDGFLVPHREAPIEFGATADAAHVLEPEQLRTISYPYEWCFEQLRDAALATLEIQRRSLESGFSLRDASAFNVQFHLGKPIFIDILSFEDLRESEPWRAYRQFCQHFLAPLALASHVDPRLLTLSKNFLDGIPLDLAGEMLPAKTRLNSGLAIHLFLHAKANSRQVEDGPHRKVGRQGHLALVDSLRRTILGLRPPNGGTEWSNYYQDTNYSEVAASSKRSAVGALLNLIDEPIETCWDLGANNGEYSRLAMDHGWHTVAMDIDHGAVSQAYAWMKQNNVSNLLPLVQDLANPTPRIGWNLQERESLTDRGPADVALSLALIHHLAIGNNVPLTSIAEFMSSIARWLVLEFVPKEDSQVQRMLRAREDIFSQYSLDGFEKAFSNRFELVRSLQVKESLRSVHLFRRRD